MAPNCGYRKISTDDDKEEEEVSFVSALFFQWMNSVLKIGSERPLDQNDFLPLSNENSACFVTEKLQTSWNKDKYSCKRNGKRPKLWKSVFKLLSVQDVMIILLGNILGTISLLLFPLFLGYLVSKLISAETENNYLVYSCAIALCFNGLIGTLSMHHRDYRSDVLGIRISSALKGLVYCKVSTIPEGTLWIFCLVCVAGTLKHLAYIDPVHLHLTTLFQTCYFPETLSRIATFDLPR